MSDVAKEHRSLLVSAHYAAIKSLRDGDIEGYRYHMKMIVESSKLLVADEK